MNAANAEQIKITSNIPVLGSYDVIVCGGGPAGIGAAVAAARNGASVLLAERLSSLGGMATSAFVSTFCDTVCGPVFTELVKRLQELGAAEYNMVPERYHKPGRVKFHGETMKLVALRMLREAGVTVAFNTMTTGAYIDEGKAKGVFIANKNGLHIALGRTIIDATADGEIAASAGADFLLGDPEDGRLMHVNFQYRIEGVDREKADETPPDEDEMIALIKQARERGELRQPKNIFSPKADTFPYSKAKGRLEPSYWELEGVDCSNEKQANETLCDCMNSALDVIGFARKHIPGYENAFVERLPDSLGTRESRRIVGDYVLGKEDVLTGKKFADGVARGSFWCDFHDSPPGTSIPYELDYIIANRPAEGDWYDIPYRTLIPTKTKNMLVAGRCISCDRWALSSLRIMPTCMYIGSAAGTAATIASQNDMDLRNVDPAEIHERTEAVFGDE